MKQYICCRKSARRKLPKKRSRISALEGKSSLSFGQERPKSACIPFLLSGFLSSTLQTDRGRGRVGGFCDMHRKKERVSVEDHENYW